MDNYKIKVKDEALFFGVGFKTGKYKSYDGNAQRKQYTLWLNMLKRCYSKSSLSARPTYHGCSLSENFRNYDFFYEWCMDQKGFGENDFQLDKDLIKKGNKVYSEDYCVFIPREVNTALITRKSLRGDLPIGVSYHNRDKRFSSKIKVKGNEVVLGYFKDQFEAFKAYKSAKEQYLTDLANSFKGLIDPRAYAALVNYEVDIND